MRPLLLLTMLLVLMLLLLIGMVYQHLCNLRDRRRYLLRGRLVDVGGGRTVYVQEAGSHGPTVVFESGIGATSQNWTAMQQSISGIARTVAYDRDGLGWSSASISERTPSNIAAELRAMLRAALVPPPYILVGHSFGGLVVRRFAADYPADVCGVALVDAMRPEEWPPLNPRQNVAVARGIRMTVVGCMLAHIGVARLVATAVLHRSETTNKAAGRTRLRIIDRITTEVGKMPRATWPVVAAHWSSPAYYRGMAEHLRAVPATVREMQDAVPIREIPVVLLTPGRAEALSTEALLRIGPTTRQIIAPKSSHWIHLDEPELVIEAIRSMVEHSKQHEPVAQV